MRKEELVQAKKEFKASIINKPMHKIGRDNIVKQMLDSDVPKWGSLKIKLVKY